MRRMVENGEDDDIHQVDRTLGHEEGGEESQEGHQGCNAGNLPPFITIVIILS